MNCPQFGTSLSLPKKHKCLRSGVVLAVLLLAAGVSAQVINVPNFSFESQSGFGQPSGVNIFIDSWQKGPKPMYFDEMAFGFFWIQTAGNFQDNNPYANRDGAQAAYMLSFPQVTLFQDYNSIAWNEVTPSHNFDPVFTIGQSYNLTLGVNGKNLTPGETLVMSLYYLDDLDSAIAVGSTTITYSTGTFPNVAPFSLTDFSVNLPAVQAGDAWAGKHIGIKIEVGTGYGDGYWDIDNVRLTAVPEPGSLALLALGAGGAWLARRRAQSRA